MGRKRQTIWSEAAPGLAGLTRFVSRASLLPACATNSRLSAVAASSATLVAGDQLHRLAGADPSQRPLERRIVLLREPEGGEGARATAPREPSLDSSVTPCEVVAATSRPGKSASVSSGERAITSASTREFSAVVRGPRFEARCASRVSKRSVVVFAELSGAQP